MFRLVLGLVLAAFFISPAQAQSLEVADIQELHHLRHVLENPVSLYPRNGINSDDALGIGSAFYSENTSRYGHNIFEMAHEYTTLNVRADGVDYSITLESDVFEDTYPLIFDFDGDGKGEIVTVQSSVTDGGSIAIYGVRDGALQKVSQSPYIGTRNRWMNIAEIADFNGDGLYEIALVDRPHIRGELEFWTIKEDMGFELRLAARGFSNHFIGSDAQRLSTLIVREGTTPLLALPSSSRNAIRLVDSSGSSIDVLSAKNLPAQIIENFAITYVGKTLFIGVMLADQTTHAFRVYP